MISTLLNNTHISVPQLSLGTMTFGGQTDEADSFAIMDYAYEQGITLFDTANIYNQGASEEIVGKWLKSRKKDITLVTKVGYGAGPGIPGISLTAESIRQGMEDSLYRLQVDSVDIYYLHAPDLGTDIRESLEAISGLIEAGKIRCYGISNYAAWQIADILAVCDREGFPKPVITQNVYNLLTRSIEPELVPFLDRHPMGLTVYNPIAAGLLTGKHRKEGALEGTRLSDNKLYRNRYWTQANLDSVEKLAAVASEAGMPMLNLAMKWCLANPKVTSILTGVSKLEQMKQNIAAVDGEPLSQDVLDACDRIWKVHTGNPFRYNR